MGEKIKKINKLEINPTSEFILVKVDPDEDVERTAGGILIPKGALNNKKTQTGTVVAIGSGRRDPHNMDKRIPMDCDVGQKILFAVYIGYPVMVPGDEGHHEEHVIIKHSDIMAFVKEDFEYVEDDDVRRDSSILAI